METQNFQPLFGRVELLILLEGKWYIIITASNIL